MKRTLRRLRRRLFRWRHTPRRVRRLWAKTGPFVPLSRAYENSAAGKALTARIERNRGGYEKLCAAIVEDRDRLASIPYRDKSSDTPHWRNHFIPPLDGMVLYTLVRTLRPKTYLEIGSGNSTKFVRKAIRDNGLATRIVSVDPCPRAEIDAICDEVIRREFQDVASDVIGRVGPGDMVFQDSSHHAFTNSDTTVFFTEFLPALPPGTVYGIHDIFLPQDYPQSWFRRYYNEQYLLLSYLLGGADGDDIVFPVAFAGQDARLSAALGGIFSLPALAGERPHGGGFWMRRAATPLAALSPAR